MPLKRKIQATACVPDVDRTGNGVSINKKIKAIERPANAPRKPPKRTKSKDDDIVSQTNALSSKQFVSRYLSSSLLQYEIQDMSNKREGSIPEAYSIMFSYANDLPSAHLQACLDLIESTSKADYSESTIGWHPRRKLKEMRQDEMRYLTAWKQDDAGVTDLGHLQGFLSFMITHEDGAAASYIYEIHLAENTRGKGLGRHLMELAMQITQAIGPCIEKVMLTCFTSNQRGLDFYRKLGFVKDESSPDARQTRGKIVQPDYVIMSKRVAIG